MALLLEKQAHELETQGYFTTTCYYPDLDEIGYNGEQGTQMSTFYYLWILHI